MKDINFHAGGGGDAIPDGLFEFYPQGPKKGRFISSTDHVSQPTHMNLPGSPINPDHLH